MINIEYLLNEINDPFEDLYFIPIVNDLDVEKIGKENEFIEEKKRMKEIEKNWKNSSIETKREYFVLKRTICLV